MASKYDPCIKQLTKVAGEAFGKEEAERLFTKLQDTANKLGSVSADKKLLALREAAGEFAEQSIMQAKVSKMRIAQATLITKDFKDHMSNFSNPVEGLKTFLTGAENVKPNAHGSVEAYMNAARFQVVKSLLGEVSDLKTIDGSKSVHDLAESGALDRRLAHSLSSLTDPDIKVPVCDAHTDQAADQVAKISKKYQDLTRNTLNLVGCNIVDLKGRITRQVHNSDTMLSMGKDSWISLAKKLFHSDTYQGKEPDKFLSSMYDAVTSGVRLSQEGKPDKSFSKFSGNMADQLSKERLVKFNDPDAFLAYRKTMKQPGSLFHDIVSEISRGNSNAALMQKMTHDPHGFYEEQTKRLLEDNRTNNDVKNKLASATSDNGRLTNIFKNITGFTSIDHNPNVSKYFDGIRAYITFCTQWLSAVKSIPDLVAGVQYLSLWGKDTFSSVGDFAKGWSNHFGVTSGSGFEQGNRNAYYLAEHFFMNQSTDWRDNNDMKGMSRKIISTVYRWNQQVRWDTVMKQSIGDTVSRIMGNYSDRPLEEIKDQQFLNSMVKYGIDKNTWDTIRQGVFKAADTGEHNYLTAEGVQKLPDSSIISYLSNKGMTPTAYAMERTRNDLATKVSLIIQDSGDHVITLAGANEKAIMNQGLQRGLGMRGVLDLVTQFRGYALANAYRTFASMIYGRGSEKMVDALLNKNGELPHIASRIALGIVCWYVSDTAKNALQGLGPRTPDLEHPTSRRNIQNGLTAMAGSGGMGPYADLLTNDFGSDASGPLEFAAGPTAGRLSKLASLAWKSTIDQAGNTVEGGKGKFPFTQDVRFAQDNIPGLSAPPVKMALNYLILYNLENWMNPKANKEREKRIQDSTGQQYFFPPSQQ